MTQPDIIELSPTRHIYPEFRYREWEQVRRPFEKIFATHLKALLEEYSISENGICLDYASGEGQGAVLLDMANRSTVIGADIDREALAEGRWIGDDENPRVVADMFDLPFRQNTFDVVLSVSGLHTLDDNAGKMALEIARVLKPAGVCIATNDTARPTGYVMSYGGLVSTTKNNRLLPGYDKNGNIAVCTSVPSKPYEAAKRTILAEAGITLDQFNTANRIMFSETEDLQTVTLLERCIAPLVASAVEVVERAEGPLHGYNPFEEALLSRLFNDLYAAKLDVKEHRFQTEIATEPIKLNIPAIGEMYAKTVERDELGNVRYNQLSRTPHSEYTKRVKSCFSVGTPE